MKTDHTRRNFILLLIMASTPLCSCRDEKKGAGPVSRNHGDCNGFWLAEGPLLLGGYQHGKYSIRMNLSENGSCSIDARIDTNKTALSEKRSILIKLEGQWDIRDDKVHTDVKAKSWVNTDHAGYHREEPLDDFLAKYVFHRADGMLVYGEDFNDNMSLATTEDAGKTMLSKGVQIHLTCPKFRKHK